MRHRSTTLLPVSALPAPLAGCGDDGGAAGRGADCSPDGCTVIFDRAADAASEVSVLGVDARLVAVRDGTVDVEVAGRQASLAVGTTTRVHGSTVGVVSVDDDEVVVSVTR